MLPIDRFAYNNNLSQVNPGEKFAFAIISLAVCLCAANAVTSLLTLLVMTGVLVFRAGIPPFFLGKLFLVPVFFLVAGTLTLAVSISENQHTFIYLLDVGSIQLGITRPGLLLAAGVFLKSMGAVSCLYFLSLTTPLTEIILVLRKLRVPTTFIELMSFVYRFIFVLMETTSKIYTSQSARLGYLTIKTTYNSLGKLIANLFAKSLYYANCLSITMGARCYNGKTQVLERCRPVSRRNIAFIILIDAGLLLSSLLAGGYRF